MRKALKSIAVITLLSSIMFVSCKDDSYLAKPLPTPNNSFTEEFDTATAAFARGWKIVNKTSNPGSGVWQDGGNILPLFNAFSNNGSKVGFIGADYNSTNGDQETISNWLISPAIHMKNGDKISFYTRAQTLATSAPPYTATTNFTDYANRMQVRFSTSGDFFEIGDHNSVGSFTEAILDINPTYTPYHKIVPGSYPAPPNFTTNANYTSLTNALAYPTEWTRFELEITGLNQPVKGRIAFRYFVEKAGNNGRATGIGIDRFEFKSSGY